MAAGRTRVSTRRTALVGLLGLGLVVGSVPALGAKHHSGDKRSTPAVNTAETGQLTTAAGKFKTVKKTFSFNGVVGIDVLGPSKQYPAAITVSGFKRGRITDVNVRIPAFFHDFPRDVDLLLVGPQGQQAIIVSDVGGDTPTPSQRDVTLDDEATQSLTAGGALATGTFKPTNVAGNDIDGIDLFPAPAPSLPRDPGSVLSVFDGTNPNGEWQLFLVDDDPGAAGVLLAPGWTLTITARVRR